MKLLLNRWLIDVDRDAEGMQVISELHGGEVNDSSAKAEYNEIRERVMFEVRLYIARLSR